MSEFGQELQLKLAGASLNVTRREFDWILEFTNGMTLRVEATWRIRNSQAIQLTDADDGHQYGLPAPVDAEARAKELLAGSVVKEVSVDNATGDLEIKFSNEIVLEVLTNSSGYESWQVYLNDDFWAAVGNGGVR